LRFRYSTEENGKLVKKAVVYTQNEHKINYHDVDSHAVYIIERLQANGYETYIVGGAVRDLILGKKPKDFDIVSAASPARIKKIFRNARIIGRRFRLVHVFFGPKIIEVSTFRSLKDGPTSNTFGRIEEDVLRRDFSLNALFYDPLKQIVVDYVGGIKDIKKRLIRPIIALPNIFTDDPVRMIRAAKYAASSGFKLPYSLKQRIRKHSQLLADVSPSRLTEEIFKIIHSPNVLDIVKSMDALGLYCYLQPRAAELFKTMPGFKTMYLKTLAALSPAEGRKGGEALSALIRDYLEDVADWDGTLGEESPDYPGPRPTAERYRSAFVMARKFILPLNPPRTELDDALRFLFAEHGVTIKKTRFYERRRRLPAQAAAGHVKAGETEENRETQAKSDNEAARKKHRHKRRRTQAT